MFDKLKNNITTKINNITNKVNDKINTIKEENEHYKELLETTTTFQNLYAIPENNIIPSEHRINIITTECPDINKDKAKLIANLIPINETYLSVFYAKEIKTNLEYYLIPTDKYFWVITTTHFGAFPYVNLNTQIVKNNLMSKTILFNNILLEITGNDNKINNFISILTNNAYRENIVKEKTNYLCGIIPTYQKINTINSGISIDANNNIVFHTRTNNYLSPSNNIDYYEILMDNTVVFSNKNSTASKLTSFQNSCYQISIRVFTKDNQTIILPILEPNSFNTKYERHDNVFQTNINFALEIINKLKEITAPF